MTSKDQLKPLALIRRRLAYIFFGSKSSRISRLANGFIYILIILNVIAVILETEKDIFRLAPEFFKWFEWVSVGVFSIEYILRVWTATEQPAFEHPVYGRIRYAFTFLALIDLAAIMPAYLPLLFTVDLRFLRILRLFRMLRVFKLGRYSKAMKLIGCVLKSKKSELSVAIFSTFLLMIIAAGMLYTVEHPAQPDKYSSIPAVMWWAVCTLTTVGYGDMVPVTILGKIFAGSIAVLGVGLFALPAGILASGFTNHLKESREKR